VCAGSGSYKPRGAADVAARRGDCGEAEKTFAGSRAYDQLAAEPEFLAERLTCGVRVAGQQRGQSEVALDDHPHGGIVQTAGDRYRAIDEVLSRHDRCPRRARRRWPS
jgi:hypothetical protein